MYQRAMVLGSAETVSELVHDHPDDLESFFYVLTHIVHVYDCNGTFHSIADMLNRCDRYEGDRAALKRGFLTLMRIPRDISSLCETTSTSSTASEISVEGLFFTGLTSSTRARRQWYSSEEAEVERGG